MIHGEADEKIWLPAPPLYTAAQVHTDKTLSNHNRFPVFETSVRQYTYHGPKRVVYVMLDLNKEEKMLKNLLQILKLGLPLRSQNLM